MEKTSREMRLEDMKLLLGGDAEPGGLYRLTLTDQDVESMKIAKCGGKIIEPDHANTSPEDANIPPELKQITRDVGVRKTIIKMRNESKASINAFGQSRYFDRQGEYKERICDPMKVEYARYLIALERYDPSAFPISEGDRWMIENVAFGYRIPIRYQFKCSMLMTPTLNWMVANDWLSPENIKDSEGTITDFSSRTIKIAEQAKVRSLFIEKADMKGIINYKECLGLAVFRLEIWVPYKPPKCFISLRDYDHAMVEPGHAKKVLPMGTLAARVVSGIFTPEYAGVDVNSLTKNLIRCILNSIGDKRCPLTDYIAVKSSKVGKVAVHKHLCKILRATAICRREIPAEWFIQCMLGIDSCFDDKEMYDLNLYSGDPMGDEYPTMTINAYEGIRSMWKKVDDVSVYERMAIDWRNGLRTLKRKGEDTEPAEGYRTVESELVPKAVPREPASPSVGSWRNTRFKSNEGLFGLMMNGYDSDYWYRGRITRTSSPPSLPGAS